MKKSIRKQVFLNFDFFFEFVGSFVSMLLIFFGHAESEATQVAALIMAGASIIGYVIGEGLADRGTAPEERKEETK